MTLLVRNEEDILGANIDYHLRQGVDFFIATDNRSDDRTRSILWEYERRGVLRSIEERADDYAQSRWVTRMARLAASEYDADWIINTDADEFWWPAVGTLKATLAAVPAEANVVVAPRHNFRPTQREDEVFAERMIIRETQSYNEVGMPLPAKVCHRADPFVVVAQGNHAIEGKCRVAEAQSIEILHFPMRSYEQFERKIRLGGSAYQRNKELAPEIGRTWRLLYELYRNGELRERYLRDVLTEDRVRDGLANGELVEDTRLRDFLRYCR